VYPWNYTVPFSISPIIHPSDHISTVLSKFLSPIYLPINKKNKKITSNSGAVYLKSASPSSIGTSFFSSFSYKHIEKLSSFSTPSSVITIFPGFKFLRKKNKAPLPLIQFIIISNIDLKFIGFIGKIDFCRKFASVCV
jgi:hypothetical protein